MKPILVVQGAKSVEDVPRLDELSDQAELRFATSLDELRSALPGADAMLGWTFREASLPAAWDTATDLRWIHWAGAGVDAVVDAEVVVFVVVVEDADAARGRGEVARERRRGEDATRRDGGE